MDNIVFVGLGSNKNDRIAYIKKALFYISENELNTVEKISSLYESKPYGVKEQGNFYNAAAKIKTQLSIKDFFIFCKKIEKKVGRTKSIKWGAREIDIDILFYNDLIYSDNELTVPHAEFLLRDFAFVPVIEINPDLIHPVLNKKLSEIEFGNIEKNIINKFTF